MGYPIECPMEFPFWDIPWDCPWDIPCDILWNVPCDLPWDFPCDGAAEHSAFEAEYNACASEGSACAGKCSDGAASACASEMIWAWAHHPNPNTTRIIHLTRIFLTRIYLLMLVNLGQALHHEVRQGLYSEALALTT